MENLSAAEQQRSPAILEVDLVHLKSSGAGEQYMPGYELNAFATLAEASLDIRQKPLVS